MSAHAAKRTFARRTGYDRNGSKADTRPPVEGNRLHDAFMLRRNSQRSATSGLTAMFNVRSLDTVSSHSRAGLWAAKLAQGAQRVLWAWRHASYLRAVGFHCQASGDVNELLAAG